MPINGYIDTVFAVSGDLTVVPDGIQSDGSISYTSGWGPYYSQDPTVDPSTALLIDRAETNQLFNDLTAAMQLIQQNGCWDFITSTMNGGSPYSYALGATCVYNAGSGAEVWVSTAAANTTTPGAGSWISLGAVGASQLQSVSATVAASALTVGYAGGILSFRNATLANGAPVSVGTGALSLVIPSGATLGTVNGVQAQLALLLAYNAGTPVLCIANMAGGLNLDETTLISPTNISGSSNSATTIYSSSTVAANSPFRVLGYLTATEATAGTWATGPTLVQGQGGQALASLQSLGYGQTWQNVTGSRSANTTYYNTTGRPIMVSIVGSSGSSTGMNGLIAGTQICDNFSQAFGGSFTPGVTFIVPPGVAYSTTSSVGSWFELR